MIASSALAGEGTSAASDDLTGAYDWNGAYAGLAGSYGWIDGTFEVDGYPPKNDNLDGKIFGAFAGVNAEFDNSLVLGIEGDLEYNIQDVEVASDFGTFTGGADWQGSTRLRVGYAFDQVLLYATAGWAAVHLTSDFQGLAQASGSFHGYSVGTGADIAVTDRIFGRIDYRYNDFGSGELDFGLATVKADLSQHTVKLGLGMKF